MYILTRTYSRTGEMMNGRPVFPGTSTLNQIEKVIELTGMPTSPQIQSLGSPYAATMLDSINPALQYKSIPETFPSAPSEARDLIKACFEFNPEHRPSAEDALRHVFVTEFHNEEEEPIYPDGTHTHLYIYIYIYTHAYASTYTCIYTHTYSYV